MPRGGRRPGAGRRRGVQNKVNASLRERLLASGISPLEFMVNMMREPMPVREDGESALVFAKRLELWSAERKFAAKESAPFLHSKLNSLEITGEDGDAIKHQHKVEIEFVEPARKK